MAATYETKGIVLRCIKYSESSVIVDIYTLTKGLRREPNEALYHFLEQYFVMLDNKKASLGLLPIKFLLELSTYIGIRPNENHGVKKPYLDMLAGECVEAMNKYTLPKTITTQLHD